MGSNIRAATADDAPKWVELVTASLGDQFPVKELYDPAWVASLLAASTQETWVADDDGQLNASISFLRTETANPNPIANIGRVLVRPGKSFRRFG